MEVFFVISGFVIAYTAEGASPASFLKSRALRLFPAALICATLTLIVILAARSATLTNGLVQTTPAEAMIMWLKSITFFPRGPWIDPPYWTLPIEVSFYAMVFLCLLTNRLKWLPSLIVMIGGLSTLWNAAVYFGFLENSDIENRWAEILLVRHGCDFAIGVLLWRAIFRRWSVIDTLAFFIFLIGGCIEIASRAAWGKSVSSFPATQPLIVPIAIWLASVGAIAASGAIHRKVRINSKVVALIRKIGIITYPFYLLHSSIGGVSMKILFDWGLPPLMCAMIALTALTALAGIVSSFLEPLARSAMLSLMLSAKTMVPERFRLLSETGEK